MSILDGLPTPKQVQDAMKIAAPMMDQLLTDLPPKEQSIIDLMKKGLPLADIFALTKQQRDAMFLKGCRMIQVGLTQKARDWLTVVHTLDPLDQRVIYAIASTYQLEGDVGTAAKLYIQFLALNATNAEGYLRLGECFLAAGEFDKAQASFGFAKVQCERGCGSDRAAAYASQMIAEVAKRVASCDRPAIKQ